VGRGKGKGKKQHLGGGKKGVPKKKEFESNTRRETSRKTVKTRRGKKKDS